MRPSTKPLAEFTGGPPRRPSANGDQARHEPDSGAAC